MNRIPKILALGVMSFVLTSPAHVAATEYKATVVAGLPETLLFVKMMPEVLLPEIKKGLEAQGDTIVFDEQYAGSIAKNGEEIDMLGAGLAEMGYCILPLRASKFPFQSMNYYTPFVSGDVGMVSNVMHAMQSEDETMAASWGTNNLVYLGGPIGVDDYVLMTTYPVNSIDDLKGKKIAAPGAASGWLSGTGAVPVSGNLSTYYNEIKTGVYSGVIVSPSLAAPVKLHEVAPYVTVMRLGAVYIGGLCASKDWHDGLPESVKKIIHDASNKTGAWYAEQIKSAYQRGLDTIAANGATVTQASEELRKTWAAGMENVATKWAKTLDDQGLPGTKVLTAYMNKMRDAGAAPVRNWDQE